MEISNKAFGVFCVAVVVVTVYVRAQSLQQKPAQPEVAVESTKVERVAQSTKKHHGIPDSPMPPDPFADSNVQATVADSSATVDEAPADETAPPAVAQPAPDAAAATDSTLADDDLTYTDDLGPMDDAVAPNNPPQLSDRDMLRIMLGSMPEEQRESFRLMWFTMSPDDRQDFLDQLRESAQSG